MKIGVLGSGDVGRRLGDGFIEHGNIVKIGSRDPTKEEVVQWVSNHRGEESKASAGTFAEARFIWRNGCYSNAVEWNFQCYKNGWSQKFCRKNCN